MVAASGAPIGANEKSFGTLRSESGYKSVVPKVGKRTTLWAFDS